MFTQLHPAKSNRQRTVLTASLASHAIFFAWLLHAPEPRLLNPLSSAHGHNGKVAMQLFWPTRVPDDSDTSSSDTATELYTHQKLAHDKLILKLKTQRAKQAAAKVLVSPYTAEDRSKTAMLSHLGHGAPLGHPYGNVPGSPVYGDEIRPALPIATVDPIVYPWERPEFEGKVIIEIMIDESGEIVRKKVLQSLGSKIDSRCLAALENWKFAPATYNGSPIASKQDAIFPFKARG